MPEWVSWALIGYVIADVICLLIRFKRESRMSLRRIGAERRVLDLEERVTTLYDLLSRVDQLISDMEGRIGQLEQERSEANQKAEEALEEIRPQMERVIELFDKAMKERVDDKIEGIVQEALKKLFDEHDGAVYFDLPDKLHRELRIEMSEAMAVGAKHVADKLRQELDEAAAPQAEEGEAKSLAGLMATPPAEKPRFGNAWYFHDESGEFFEVLPIEGPVHEDMHEVRFTAGGLDFIVDRGSISVAAPNGCYEGALYLRGTNGFRRFITRETLESEYTKVMDPEVEITGPPEPPSEGGCTAPDLQS